MMTRPKGTSRGPLCTNRSLPASNEGIDIKRVLNLWPITLNLLILTPKQGSVDFQKFKGDSRVRRRRKMGKTGAVRAGDGTVSHSCSPLANVHTGSGDWARGRGDVRL